MDIPVIYLRVNFSFGEQDTSKTVCYRKTPRSHNLPTQNNPDFPAKAAEQIRSRHARICSYHFAPPGRTPTLWFRFAEARAFRASARQQSNSTAKKAARVDSTTSRQKQRFPPKRALIGGHGRGTGCPASRCRRSIWVATPTTRRFPGQPSRRLYCRRGEQSAPPHRCTGSKEGKE